MYLVLAYGAVRNETRHVRVTLSSVVHRFTEDSVFLVHAHREKKEHAVAIGNDLARMFSAHDPQGVDVFPEENVFYAVTVFREIRAGCLEGSTKAFQNGVIQTVKKGDILRIVGVHATAQEAVVLAKQELATTARIIVSEWKKIQFTSPVLPEHFSPDICAALKS
jgi:hypothetical protein